MTRTLKIACFAAALCCTFGWNSPRAIVTFDLVHIGNAGNAGELAGSGAGGFGPDAIVGAVPYNYAISTTEVTNAQYTEFLNAVDPTGANALGLFNSDMASFIGGIDKTGIVNGAHYVAKTGRNSNPVTYVSWYDSVRFINWLHNGQGSGDTETGAYTLLGGTATPTDGLSVTRNTDAKYWLPSENEWYKAAYHDASAGTAAVYFNYATRSDAVPVSDGPADNPGAVNYYNNDGLANGFNDGYAVGGSASFPPINNPWTDVGAYTAAKSPYGTYDQNGNAWEWTETLETVAGDSFRMLAGGSWNATLLEIAALSRRPSGPIYETGSESFRIATAAVPEPSAMLTAALASLGPLLWRKR